MMKKSECCICYKSPLTKDEIAITKKLIDPDTKKSFCIPCLAEYLDCSEDDIYDKIEEFKEEGCTLFI